MNDLSIHSSAQHQLHALQQAGQTAHTNALPNELVEMAQFNLRAGVHNLFYNAVAANRMIPLSQRRTTNSAQTPTASSDANGNANSLTGELESAAAKVVEDLRESGKTEVLERLTDVYDPLERHTLLRAAQNQVATNALDPEERERLKAMLGKELDALMASHGDAITKGIESTRGLEQLIAEMATDVREDGSRHIPNTLHALRVLYGGKGGPNKDEPLTPLALASAFVNRFGAGNFMQTLSTFRSRMAVDLRSIRAADTGPRLWLSLSDASCFNALQSCFAIAGDLRRSLSERARVVPKGSQIDTTLVLLALPDSGGQAETIASKLLRQRPENPFERMQTFMALRRAVETMPISMWDARLLLQRLAIIDDLRKAAVVIGDALPSYSSQERSFEQELRDRQERERKRKRNQVEEVDDEEGDDSQKLKNGGGSGWKNSRMSR